MTSINTELYFSNLSLSLLTIYSCYLLNNNNNDKRNSLFSRKEVISKQDVLCSEKLPGQSPQAPYPVGCVISALTVSWKLVSTMRTQYISIPQKCPMNETKVFTKMQPGLEPEHSSVHVHLSRDAGM